MGYGEMKGWDGPVSVKGIKDEPEGQQSDDADGHETEDGIPHLKPRVSCIWVGENKQAAWQVICNLWNTQYMVLVQDDGCRPG